MSKRAFLGAIGFLTLLSITSASVYAGLIGDGINWSLKWVNKDTHQAWMDFNACIVKDPGEEFRISFTPSDGCVEAFADFGADTLTVGFQEVSGNSGALFELYPDIVFKFTDLNMSGAPSGITGLILIGKQGDDSVSFSSTADSITVIWNLLDVGAGCTESITLEIVPEPGTVLLLGLGAVMLMRKKVEGRR
jgi:hypothetical protein